MFSVIVFGMFAILAACERERPVNEAEVSEPPQQPLSIGEPAPQMHVASGSVTAIDRQAGQITINHDPITTLNWPSMTMSFSVKDSSLLNGVQTGDRVTFALVENDDKQYVIQEIRRQ